MMLETRTRFKGGEAERRAEKYLQGHGLISRERNYRSRFGEIDLIMQDGTVVVFVEVRMRASLAFGGAAGSITLSKQAKLVRTARQYLATLNSVPPCRFDAVLLSGSGDRNIEWIRNAFGE